MRSVMRMRHYCDHCTKSMGTKPAMAKHERGCTLNPDRVCRVCELQGEVQLSMPELQSAFDNGFKALREACHDCPVCILAADRQYHHDLGPDDGPGWDSPRNTERDGWNFTTAMKEFWVRHNAEHNANHAGYY